MRRTMSIALTSLALAACEAAPHANAPGDGSTGTPAAAAAADSGTSGGSVVTSPDGGILVTGGGTGGATADGGLGAWTTDAGVACAPEACPGPAPLSPSVMCPDDSVAGPRCVALDDAGCAWRILVCPPPLAVPAGSLDGG